MVQGELSARSQETKLVTDPESSATTSSDAIDKLSQQVQWIEFEGGRKEEKNVCYHEDNDDYLIGERIVDLDVWEPTLLPCMMKHTEWLPIGTPPQLYEGFRAMKGFKTNQARKNRKIPSIVGGTSLLALLVALIVVALTLISSLYASNLIQAEATMPSFESSKSDKPSLVPRITAASTVFSSTFVHDTPHFSNSDLRLRCYHCMSSRYSSPLTDVCLADLFLPPAVL